MRLRRARFRSPGARTPNVEVCRTRTGRLGQGVEHRGSFGESQARTALSAARHRGEVRRTAAALGHAGRDRGAHAQRRSDNISIAGGRTRVIVEQLGSMDVNRFGEHLGGLDVAQRWASAAFDRPQTRVRERSPRPRPRCPGAADRGRRTLTHIVRLRRHRAAP